MPITDRGPLPVRLRRVLTADPQAPALHFEGRSYPWRFLQRAVDDLDGILAAAGASDAHRIGIVLRNRPGHFAALVAVIATGRQVITLNPHQGDVALAEDVRTLAPQVVIAAPVDWAAAGIVDESRRLAVVAIETGEDERPLVPHTGGWAAAPAPAERGEVAVLMQTSGTTGRPKRIELGYDQLTASLEASGTPVRQEHVQLRARPAILWTSLVHIGGAYFVVANVAAGLQTALLERFDVRTWADAVRRTRPRRLSLAPAALRMVMQSDLPSDLLDGVQWVSAGTAPLGPDEADRFTARFGVPVISTYGATEFAGAIAGWTAELFEEFGRTKRGSTGRAFQGVELRIVDRSTGDPLPMGEVGLLEARGAQLPGEDWVRTTDLARLDDDGFLFIHGRVDDAINRGGFTVVPGPVEELLRSHPAVRDASVVGIPDTRLGEVPVAAVVVHDDRCESAELQDWLGERLARYYVPARIKIVDELPRTPSMKISRPAVQALFAGDGQASA